MNKVIYMHNIKLKSLTPDMLRIILNGCEFQSINDFYDIMAEKFSFPTSCNGLVARYLDWMRDLSWMNYDSCEIHIVNQNDFLKLNIEDRENILNDFNNIILPY